MRQENDIVRCAGAAVLALLAALPAAAQEPAPAPAAMQVSATAQAPVEPEPLRVEGDQVRLTLEEAIEIALRRNLTLAVERYNRVAAQEGIIQNRGIYDLNATAEGLALDTEAATISTLEASLFEQQTLNAAVSQLFPTGGTLSVGVENRRRENNLIFNEVNPSYDSTAGFRLNQPLLRGFGRLPTERLLRIARLTSEISAETFETQVASIIQQVDSAYWDLVEAREQLKVSEEGLTLARELHNMNRIRVDVGTLAPLEMVQSEVGIATREEEIIRNRAAVGDAADRLRRLLNVEQGALWEAEIVPETDPTVERITIDVAAALQTAMAERPEIERQRLTVRTEELDARYFRNQQKPRFDLNASYGFGGTGGVQIVERDPVTGTPIVTVPGGYSDALDQIRGLDFPEWTFGFTFAFPLQNRTARAQTTIAQLETERAEATLKDLEQLIRTEVRTAARAVDTAAKQIDSARVSRQLAEKNLDAERKRYENGMSTSFQVLEIQEDLTAARSREVSAVTAYRRALAEYHRATGRLLEATGVEIGDVAAR